MYCWELDVSGLTVNDYYGFVVWLSAGKWKVGPVDVKLAKLQAETAGFELALDWPILAKVARLVVRLNSTHRVIRRALTSARVKQGIEL